MDVDTLLKGRLKLGLKFLSADSGLKATGTLMVNIKQATELPEMDDYGTNPLVKLYLLPNRKSSGKRKTSVIKNNLNPIWEEKFAYKNVSREELLQKRTLEINIWSNDKSGNKLIGCLHLGPGSSSTCKPKDWMDSIGDEMSHWQNMLDHPGEWVEQWHMLRTNLNPDRV